MAGASFITLAMAMILEFIIYSRRHFVSSIPAGTKRLAASASLYGAQMALGYILMLLAMTYSGPLFMCVILGLVSGHILFNAKDSILSTRKNIFKVQASESEINTENPNYGAASSGIECAKPPTKKEKQKTESQDMDVPEGLTPCCQNEL